MPACCDCQRIIPSNQAPGTVEEGKPTALLVFLDVGGCGAVFEDERIVYLAPVLVSQGINEQQTVANLYRHNTLENEVNEKAIDDLQEYFSNWAAARKPAAALKGSLRELDDVRQKMDVVAKRFKRAKDKDVTLLQNFRDLTYALDGGRIISCKSAKDRTSMAITLEQATFVASKYGGTSGFVGRTKLLDVMRMRGSAPRKMWRRISESRFTPLMLRRGQPFQRVISLHMAPMAQA